MFRHVLRPAAALLSTTAFFALAVPAQAQSLDVPAGSTYALTADESHNTLTGAGDVNLSDSVLTIGADGSSSTFNGHIGESGWNFAGSWVVFDGLPWGTHTARS